MTNTDIFNLINFLIPDGIDLIIPEGIDKLIECNGQKIHVTKKDGKLRVKLKTKFNDSDIKQTVAEFKQSIEDLDDCIFVDVIEELGDSFDKKRFDQLLNLTSYTRKDAQEVTKMIDQISSVISEHLHKKIEELIDLQERF